MEETVMDGVRPFLPQEIISNILKRLPVKSLILFQCVSKEWKNLIKAPSFMEDHLHHSSNQNPSLLLQQNDENGPLHLRLLDGQMRISEVHIPPLMENLLGARIIGSSNGLVCVAIDRYNASSPSLLLWNPSIRQVRPVPVTRFDSMGYWGSGFGFCPIDNDYKIVRTYRRRRGVSRVEVFSMNAWSWKEIEFENLDVRILVSVSVSLNGRIYFLGLKEEGAGRILVLVSFDIALGVFNVIPWPPLECNEMRKATVYDNKLAIICLNVIRISESSFVDLWVMEEGTGSSGERWSWTKKCRSRTYPYSLYPMNTWGNEIICRGYVTGTDVENDKPKAFICRINVSTKESTMHNIGSFYHVFNYVESLVPVC